jgi:hypothetical protein
MTNLITPCLAKLWGHPGIYLVKSTGTKRPFGGIQSSLSGTATISSGTATVLSGTVAVSRRQTCGCHWHVDGKKRYNNGMLAIRFRAVSASPVATGTLQMH